MKARPLLALAVVLLACVGGNWADLNETGKAAYTRGEYARAERLFREALVAAPDEQVRLDPPTGELLLGDLSGPDPQ